MFTIYAPGNEPTIDYSRIMDAVLLRLRNELRADLSQISEIEWNQEQILSKEECAADFDL